MKKLLVVCSLVLVLVLACSFLIHASTNTTIKLENIKFVSVDDSQEQVIHTHVGPCPICEERHRMLEEYGNKGDIIVYPSN